MLGVRAWQPETDGWNSRWEERTRSQKLHSGLHMYTMAFTHKYAYVHMYIQQCFKELILISNVSARIPYQTEPEAKIKHESSWCANPWQQGWRKEWRVSREKKALNQWDTMHRLMGLLLFKSACQQSGMYVIFFWIDWKGKHTHFRLLCKRNISAWPPLKPLDFHESRFLAQGANSLFQGYII